MSNPLAVTSSENPVQKNQQPTEQQLEIIRQQIGREPVGIRQIAVASSAGVPLSLQMESVVDNKPFPTLYWLCSRDLSRVIGQIETQGWVKDVEQRIMDDQVLRERHLADQHRYVALRTAQMTAEQQQWLTDKGLAERFASYGIGGISQWDKVRCLHMQYAFHLAEGSTIGELLDEEFELDKMLQDPQLG